MKLEKSKENILGSSYRCDLTLELDKLSEISEFESYDLFYHYIVADKIAKSQKCLAIRVPGGTVGGIYIDDNNIITDIDIDTNYVVKSYPEDINKIIKEKFVGQMIEY